MCKYNSHYYWEDALINHKDLWQGNFPHSPSAQNAIFVNTAVIDYHRGTLDNNWSCYTDVKSLLGFIQYVYLPLAFYYTLNEDLQQLYIPIRSSSSFLDYIKNSGSEFAGIMESTLWELNSFWDLEAPLCMERIKNFCIGFNAFWEKEGFLLHISVFSSTFEIARHLVDSNEFTAVLEEDIGMTVPQLFTLCEDFYQDKFLQRNFVKILNHKIGCIV